MIKVLAIEILRLFEFENTLSAWEFASSQIK
jgi:hypothetical protein